MKKQILLIPITLIILSLWVSSCKEDCKNPIKITQDYKLYQSWYPYKEKDTLNFLRLPENDTLIFYGSVFSFPTYDIGVECNCCGLVRNEYLRQTFLSKDMKDSLRVEMDGSNIKFRVNGRWDYGYDIGGHPLLLSEVTTPDSVYTWAYKKDDAGNSCYYARKVGIVKYVYDNNGVWLLLRNK
jgi:hypothetical protein